MEKGSHVLVFKECAPSRQPGLMAAFQSVYLSAVDGEISIKHEASPLPNYHLVLYLNFQLSEALYHP